MKFIVQPLHQICFPLCCLISQQNDLGKVRVEKGLEEKVREEKVKEKVREEKGLEPDLEEKVLEVRVKVGRR